MAIKEELRQAFGAAQRVAVERAQIHARVGISNGDGTYTLRTTTRPHRIWVTTDGGTTAEVANMGVPLIAGQPVILERINGDLTATRIDHIRTVATMGPDFPSQPVAPHTHRIGFGLDDLVEELRLEPGLLYAGDDLEVRVLPFWYAQDGYWPDTTTLDLAGNQPAAGQHRWVRVGFDPSGPTMEAASGTAVPVSIPLNVWDIADIALSDSSILPIGAVRLDGSATTWTGPRQFVSARLLLGIESGGGDVTGPGSSTDNAIARFDGVGGKTLQDSGVTIDDNDRLILPDDADYPPLNVTERSAAPNSPAANDIYLDDGTNTESGEPGWRRWNGAAWEDVGALSGGGGSSTLAVVNNSGDAASEGDVMLLRYDGTDAYEAITTTTANDVGIWAVVETGGADGAAITVYRSGTGITVNYTGSAPNKGEYLVTSTTAGSAQAQAYMSPEVFAVCTANGATGTVEATLLCHTEYISLTSSYEVYRNRDTSAYDFVATINGAPAGATLVYNVPSSGAADTIRPFEGDTTQLAKLRLYNSTRGTYALVSDVDLGTKTITVTDAADIGSWQSGDTITARSQTNTTTTGGGTAYYYDYEIEDASVIPQLTRTINFFMFAKDTAAASIATTLHPWEANATSKQIFFDTQAVNSNYSITGLTLPIINRRFCLNSQASGSGTKFNTLRLLGVFVAAP